MDRSEKYANPSIYAETAYQLILSGVKQFPSEGEQRLLLDSLLWQCAIFSRMVGGDEAFHALLDRLRDFDLDTDAMQHEVVSSGFH
ncbi:hypothetical protein JG725_16960 [Brenneria sp. L3-3C-1]|nr:hypothetical protein [Brenneria sp. L3-3C-1]